jgi:plastocyanin
MKSGFVFPAACALYLAGTFLRPANPNPADTKPEARSVTVAVKSLSFSPKKLEVRVGDSVAWANEARTTHTATSDDDGKTFDTGEIEPGGSSKPVKFEKEGEFKYHCKVRGKVMSGAIIVKAAGKG